MPKPPTSQRGRPARTVPLEAPPPAKRPLLRRFVSGSSQRSLPAPVARATAPPRRSRAAAQARREAPAAPPIEDAPAESGPGGLLGAVAAAGWRPLVSTLLCVLGLGASVYLTIGHYAHYSLDCPVNATFDCEAVTHSPQSYVFGIPVALLGLVYFVPMLVLCLPWAWRSRHRLVAPARLAGVVASVGFVFYLIYNELFVIGKICLWCSSVHLISLLLFVVVATGWDEATAAARSDGEERWDEAAAYPAR